MHDISSYRQALRDNGFRLQNNWQGKIPDETHKYPPLDHVSIYGPDGQFLTSAILREFPPAHGNPGGVEVYTLLESNSLDDDTKKLLAMGDQRANAS